MANYPQSLDPSWNEDDVAAWIDGLARNKPTPNPEVPPLQSPYKAGDADKPDFPWARELDAAGRDPAKLQFLQQNIFNSFDKGLIPEADYTNLLQTLQDRLDSLAPRSMQDIMDQSTETQKWNDIKKQKKETTP